MRRHAGNRKIFAYLLDWFKLHGLEETLWLTQISQAMCINTPANMPSHATKNDGRPLLANQRHLALRLLVVD